VLRNAINFEHANVNEVGNVEHSADDDNESDKETERRRAETARNDRVKDALANHYSEHLQLYQHFYLELATYLRNPRPEDCAPVNESMAHSTVGTVSSRKVSPNPLDNRKPDFAQKRDLYFGAINKIISKARQETEAFSWKNMNVYEARTLYNVVQSIVLFTRNRR
jgi:hypothetical protein